MLEAVWVSSTESQERRPNQGGLVNLWNLQIMPRARVRESSGQSPANLSKIHPHSGVLLYNDAVIQLGLMQ